MPNPFIKAITARRHNITFKLFLAVLIFILSFNMFSIARGAGELSVEIIAGPNLVVDSNAGTPASSAPNVATVIGKICNYTGATVTNAYTYIGNYTGPSTGTPGIYPSRVNSEGWGDGGTYSFTHIGGAAGTNNATRLIGSLADNECVYQYWHFEYPLYNSSNTPMHGDNAKPEDDFWLDFDVWATADGGLDGSATHTMYFRNEISAMANKIEPNGNPPGVWFNTDTNQIKVGETYTTNGINYDLGNINKGFDNDGDGDYDYNAWLQPFGMNNFDPSCFQLEGTEVDFTVRLSGGLPDLIIHTHDQLYFTDEDYLAQAALDGLDGFDASMVTTASGKVYYTFRILSLPCSAPLTPYQEMASGADNEKFNADYGTAVPGVTAIAPSFNLDKQGQLTVAKGDNITYTLYTNNTGDTSMLGLFSSTNPLTIIDSIPDGLTYVGGTASTTANIVSSGTLNVMRFFSTDNRATWSTTEPGDPTTVTDLKWVFDDNLPPTTQAYVQFQANTASYNELTSPTGPVIENCSQTSLGTGTAFDESCTSTILLGDNTISGTAWLEEDANGFKEIANGETYQDNVNVTLYYDNGSVPGEYDDGDTYIAATTTGSPAGDNTYAFTGLPNGSYVVVVDTETNIPTGYRPSTDIHVGVTLTGGQTIIDQDFGFASPFYMNKAALEGSSFNEGDQVTYEIILQNNLPGANGSGFCEYTVWADSFGPNEPSVGSNSAFINPDYALGAPDSVFSVTDLDNSANLLHLTGFNLGQQQGNITSVKLLVIADEDSGPINNGDVVITDVQNSGLTSFWEGVILNTNMDGTPGTYQELTPLEYTKSGQTYTQIGDGIISTTEHTFTWTEFTNNNLYIELLADKGNVSPHNNIRIDAVGMVVTTDSTDCGSAADSIETLPLTDSYDPTELKFISASPAQSSPTGDPLPNPGTITWNDLGPLDPGETQRVTVTFEVLDPGIDPATGGLTVQNCSNVDGTAAFFADGEALKDGSITSCVDITALNSGQIGDLIFADLDGGNDYDPGEPGIPSVTVELWCDSNNSDTYTGSPQDTLLFTTVTDSDGYYNFDIDSSLTCATNKYLTRVVPLATMTQSFDPDGTLNNWSLSNIVLNDNNTANDVDLTRDFGYTFSSSTVSGIVWNDADADHNIDENEPFYSGIPVTLYSDTDGDCTNGYGAFVDTTTTDANGAYTFSSIASTGYYCVNVDNSTLPAQVTDPDGTLDNLYSVNIVGHGVYQSYDFGYRPTGSYSIGDRLWIDWDGDGLQDLASGTGAEEGLNGIPVQLYYCDSTADAACTPDLLWETQTTSGDGDYLFSNLPEGRYQVVIDEAQIPAGYIQTGDPDSTLDGQSEIISLNSGNPNPDIYDFGYQPTGIYELGDFVYYDKNNNGIYDTIGTTPDTPLSGITVELYYDANNDGQIDSGDALVGTYTTTTDGSYIFTDLPDGNFLVRAPANPGIYFTNASGTGEPYSIQDGYVVYDVLNVCVDGVWTGSPPVGAPSGMLTDSNACDAYRIDNTSLGTANNDYDGSSWYEADFGYTTSPASVGDVIWVDANQDGLQGSQEPGINGVVVELWGDLDGSSYTYITQTTTATEPASGQEGYYLFTGLIPGDYQIRVTDLSGATVNGSAAAITSANLVYDPDDSTFSTSTGTVNDCASDGCDSQSDVTLYPNSYNTGQDFGYRPNASIGDTLWVDSNGDGVIDSAEARLSGVTVNLYQGASLIASVQTDEFGEYAFPIFDTTGSTDYRVEVPTTVGPFTLTYEVKDSEDCTLAACDGASTVTISGDGQYLDQDFGYQSLDTSTPGTISGTVFHDSNDDTTLDRDASLYEPGYQNVTVSLWINNNGSWVWYADLPSDPTGYYEFTNLDAGTYRVFVDTDNAQVSDLALTTPLYYEVTIPSGGGDFPNNDFGFYGDVLVAVGNLVWNDNGASTNFNNSIFDADESGINGVTIDLYLDDGDGAYEPGTDDVLLVSRETADSPAAEPGYFIFEGLRESSAYSFEGNPGQYYLHIPTTEFQAGGTLESFVSSDANVTTDDDIDQDADENGQTPATDEATDGVFTVMFTLENGTEPDTEDSGDAGDSSDTYTSALLAKLADNAIDFTKDFAFYSSQPDIAIDKTVTPTAASEGEEVTFTITVTNSGTSAATTIQVQDVLPGAYTYVAASMTANPYATGAVITAPDNTAPDFTWEIDQLDPGESVDLTFKATYSHKATVSFTVTNNTGADILALDAAVTIPGGFIYIDNSINTTGTPDESAAPVLAWNDVDIANGASATFSFDVAYSNTTDLTFDFDLLTATDAGGAGDLDISTTISAPFIYDGSIVGGSSNDDSGAPTLDWILTDPASLLPATISFELNQDATNLAQVIFMDQTDADSTPNNGVDTNSDGLVADDPGDEDDGDGVIVTPVYVDLSLDKSVSPATAAPGDPVTFTITVTNNGTADETGINIQDIVPDGYTNISNISDSGVNASGTITWSSLSLTTGSSIALTFDAEVVDSAVSYLNLAQITAQDHTDLDSTPNNGVDTDGDTNTIDDPGDEDDGDGAEITLPSTLIATITKTADDNLVPETGQDVTFTLDFENTGSLTIVLNTLTDDIFGNLFDNANLLVPSATNNCLALHLSTLAPSGTTSCTFVANVAGDYDAAVGDHENTVTLGYYEDGNNTNTGSANDNEIIEFEDVLPTVSVDKTADGSDIDTTFSDTEKTADGSTVTFQVVVTNTSDEAITLDSLTDSVAGNLHNVGTCSVPQTINPAANYTCTFDSTTLVGQNGTDHTNTVTANVSDDDTNTDSGNDDTTVDILPSITVTKDADDDNDDSFSDPESVAVSGTVVYRVQITNNTDEDLTITSITDDVVTGSLTSVSKSGQQCSDAINDTIAANSTLTCYFDGTAPNTSGTNLQNEISVTATDDENNPATGTDTADVNTPAVSTATIGDLVYYDVNGNGTFDSGTESGIDGVTVNLYLDNNNDGLVDGGDTNLGEQTTAGGGAYDFTGLAAGNYLVVVTDTGGVLTGYTLTGGTDPHDVTLAESQDYNAADFGYDDDPENATIGDLVYYDANGNGTFDSGTESGIDGVTVNLYLDNNNDGLVDGGDTNLGEQTTAGGGAYDFTGLAAGNYLVVVTDTGGVLTGYTLTGGTDPHDVTLAESQDYNAADFGYDDDPENATIGDLVYYDANGNGTFDSGTESGIDGVTVNLYLDNNNDGLVDGGDTNLGEQTTAGGGAYDFTGLAAGNYLVVVTDTGGVLTGYTLTGGTDPHDVTLAESQDYNAADFGYDDDPENATIGDLVYYDVNGNGTFDSGTESGIDGVTVNLYLDNNNDGLVDGGDTNLGEQTTAGGGAYDFTGLAAGNYLVVVTDTGGLLTGYTLTGGTDPHDVTLAESQDYNAADFGYDDDPENATIGDLVYYDANGNGTFDSGTESGIDGITVNLYLDNNNDGLVDGGDTNLGEQTTAGGGAYDFTGLAAGNYLVVVTDTGGLLTGYTLTGGTDPHDVTLAESQDYNAADFGYDDDTTPGIMVTKSPDVNPVIYDGTVNFTIEVTNTGNVALNTITVTDALCDAAPVYDSGDDGNNLLDLTETWIYTCSTANVTAAFTNEVTATGIDNLNGGDPVEDTDTVDITVNTTAGINIEKTPDNQTITGGENAVFTLTVTNTGVVNLDNVVITDTYCDTLSGPSGDLGADGILTPSEIWIYQCTDNDVLSGYTNTAQVDAEDPFNNPVTDSDTADVTLNGTYSVEKSVLSTEMATGTGANGELVTIGEIVQYQIVVTLHNGNTIYPDLTIVDTMDTGLAFMECVSITGNTSGFSASCNEGAGLPDITPVPSTPAQPTDGRIATYNFGDQTTTGSTNNTITITYNAVVLNVNSNTTGTVLDNLAEIDGSGVTDTGDPLEIVEPFLDIRKTTNNEYASAGDLVSFDIQVFHNDSSTTDAYDVIMHDVIPAGLIYEPGTNPDHRVEVISGPTPSDISFVGGEVTVTWDEIGSGETVVVRLYATIAPTLPDGETITNIASVEWTSLPGDRHTTPSSPYNEDSTERWYDPADSTGLNIYGGITASSVITIGDPPSNITTPQALPNTGFAPGRITTLPEQPASLDYQVYDNEIRLEIPKLGIDTTIVGVPMKDGEWDTTWLWDNLGYLEGTAFPTVEGNTVITGHVYQSDGNPGPFVNLRQLSWGDQIIIHANGQKYVYEVRTTHYYFPTNTAVLSHKDHDWVTLLTCSIYNEVSDSFAYRFAVQAVLTSVIEE